MKPTKADNIEAYMHTYADELAAFANDRAPEGEAEDLMQEVWSSFAQSMEDQLIEDPRAWLYRATRNRLTDSYRQTSRRPTFLENGEENDWMAEVEEEFDIDLDPEEFWAVLDDALDELPAAQRLVFVRNELEGETLQEIADELGERLKTIISRKQYARQKLQIYLADYYEQIFNY